jgi:hypothetical protein
MLKDAMPHTGLWVKFVLNRNGRHRCGVVSLTGAQNAIRPGLERQRAKDCLLLAINTVELVVQFHAVCREG